MEASGRLGELCRFVDVLPESTRRTFVAWAAGRAGVPLGEEASLERVVEKIEGLSPRRALEVVNDLEDGLVQIWEPPVGEAIEPSALVDGGRVVGGNGRSAHSAGG